MADNVAHPEPPIEYPVPVDLVALVRSYEPPEGERGPLSISGCPKYLPWAVESLSDRASVSQARTYACLLDVGMRGIWRFSGARDLQRAREKIVAGGDAEMIRWVDTWEFDVPTADTGATIPKVRLSVMGSLTPLGKLAKVLGFPKSKTAVIALAVTLLDDTAIPIRYRQAQTKLLRDFADKLRMRAEKATEYAARGSDPGGNAPAPRSSLADIIGVRV